MTTSVEALHPLQKGIIIAMLNQEQINQFHRDGLLIIRGIFKGKELEELGKAATHVQEEGVAGKGEHHQYYDQPDGKKTYFRSEKMWDRDDVFQAATVNPKLLECIGQCVGHPLLPINDSFVCKIPRGNVPIHWHQDPPYRDPERGESFDIPNFDTDIYLDHSTIDNGCVWGIPGHHLVGHVELEKYSADELFEKSGAVPIEMEPGDVLFHALTAPHGSRGNSSGSNRKIFYVHYMNEEVLDDGYPGWKDSKRCYSQEGKALVKNMLEVRKRLDFEGIENSHIRWIDDGFEFFGEPKTPPRHWRTLIDQMSEEEKLRKKRLKLN